MQSSENNPEQIRSSYVKRFDLIAGSALEEAECFVASLKTLKGSLSSNTNPVDLERDLKDTMDQYVRLTMVCDVLKVFNPFKSQSHSPSPQPQLASFESVSIKEEPTEIKPSLILNPQMEVDLKPSKPTSQVPSLAPLQQQTPTKGNISLYGSSALTGHLSLAPGSLSPSGISTNSSVKNEVKMKATASNTTALGPRKPKLQSTLPPLRQPANVNTTNNSSSSSSNSSSNINNSNNNNNQVDANGISTEKFIDTFEALLTYFSEANKLSKDDTWEKLFIHSLPQQHKTWFNQKLQGKHYTWEDAKRMFFAENDNNNRPSSASPPKQPIRSEKQRARARQTRFAEALLNLEMKDNDSLSEYNQKFKRYSESAGMICDTSLLKRYANSLAKRYRELALPLLSHPDYNNSLTGLMHHIERLDEPRGLVQVDSPCSHNWNLSTTFKPKWPATTQKRRAMDDGFNVEKRTKSQPVS